MDFVPMMISTLSLLQDPEVLGLIAALLSMLSPDAVPDMVLFAA